MSNSSNMTVSVIIPVYNLERYIERCVHSVMNQSYRDLQIIVIDDGSTDDSLMILKRLASADSRITLISRGNAGVGAARNVGIDAAEGRYLTFVDGDDYISPNYIRRYVRCMRETGAQMVIGGLDYVSEDGRVLKRLVPGRYERFRHEEWPQLISCVCSHFYLRELWVRSGLRFSEGRERGEDVPVSIYFAASVEKISMLSSSGYYYVQRQSSATHSFRGLKKIRLPYHALEEVIQRLKAEGVANSRQFHEVFVLRMLAMCAFDMARGADREKKTELCDYIYRVVDGYYPDYGRNPLVRISADTEYPLAHKVAVRVLVELVKHHMLYQAIRFI